MHQDEKNGYRVHDGPVFGAKRRRASEGKIRPPRPKDQTSVRWGTELIERAEAVSYRMSTKPPFHNVTFAELARWGLKELLDRLEAGDEVRMPERRVPCSIALGGGMAWCSQCGTRWTVKEGEDFPCPVLAAEASS